MIVTHVAPPLANQCYFRFIDRRCVWREGSQPVFVIKAEPTLRRAIFQKPKASIFPKDCTNLWPICHIYKNSAKPEPEFGVILSYEVSHVAKSHTFIDRGETICPKGE